MNRQQLSLDLLHVYFEKIIAVDYTMVIKCYNCWLILFLSGSCTIKGQIFQKCATCPATCSAPDLLCIQQCTPGCGCPVGELIDTVNKKCVEPNQCPKRAVSWMLMCNDAMYQYIHACYMLCYVHTSALTIVYIILCS